MENIKNAKDNDKDQERGRMGIPVLLVLPPGHLRWKEAWLEDEERLWELKDQMRKDGYFMSWNDEENKSGTCLKQTTRIEIYIKVEKDLPFKEKMAQIKEVLKRYELY